LLLALLVLGACGDSSTDDTRPSQEQWSTRATIAVGEIQSRIDGMDVVNLLLPGDYIPRTMLRSCFSIGTSLDDWEDLLKPGPTEDLDAVTDRVLDNLEQLCLDLHEADVPGARAVLLEAQSALDELRTAAG
jgi:hypothetical protein